jgi:nicotinamide riboside kinase
MERNLRQTETRIIKITIFGPESTGKTTLAYQLAEEFHTNWTPEYARDYLQILWETKQKVCSYKDILPIAIGQIKLENEALKLANEYLFCDTNLLTTKLFSDINYGKSPDAVSQAAISHEYDLFFLTDIDIPWVADDLRSASNRREKESYLFEKALIDLKKPYIKLSGNKTERLQKAKLIIEELTKAKNIGFSSQEFIEIYQNGISIDKLENQMEFLANGIPKINLNRPAKLNDGILPLTKKMAQEFADIFDRQKEKLSITKFVPASGAASRMFKFLLEFDSNYNPYEESINSYVNKIEDKNLSVFLIAKDKFPFYKEVLNETKNLYPDYASLSNDNKDYCFVKTLLHVPKFDFANKPKGVLAFHNYPPATETPIEEHLKECLAYANSESGSNLHFTVSEEHKTLFEKVVQQFLDKNQTAKNIKISYSFQQKKTNSIALSMDNTLFKDAKNKLVFRPGGHGALIENLNELHSDILFVKNIDNVSMNNFQNNALYKKALGGILLEYQKEVFENISLLQTEDVSVIRSKVIPFVTEKLNIKLPEDFEQINFQRQKGNLLLVLNRPIRVCGMVKNEGEAGGGPYWVTNKHGENFLQIIEESQINKKDENQNAISKQTTHFNPVDLVCGILDYQGNKFDLTKFVDKNQGFVVEKNKDGKDLKAFELPGLWNGAMAKWITIFVEVPLFTFNPVKTVNDLLKPAHQFSEQ